jgi:ABC-type amino acid transport substrate-binding protein
VAGDIKGKVIYVIEKFLLHRMVVSPQIKRFEDLKGKKIAISAFGTLTDMLTREILTDHGLKPMQDVLLLQTGGAPVRLAALQSNNVQGALLSSQQALAAKREGYRILDYNPPPYVSHPLIAKNEMLEKEPATVRGLLRAVYKATCFTARSRKRLFPWCRSFSASTIAVWRGKPMKTRCAATIREAASSQAA